MEMMPKVKQSFSEPSDPHNVPHSNLISQPYSFEPHVSSWFDNWCWANRLPQTHPFYPRPLSLFSHLSAHFTFSFLFFRASPIPLFPHPHTPFIVNANLVGGFKTWYPHHARTLQHPLGERQWYLSDRVYVYRVLSGLLLRIPVFRMIGKCG